MRFADHNMPQDIIEILAWYMTHDQDPERDLWRPDEPTVYYGGDVYMAGINSVRGSAAEDIAKLLWADPERLTIVRDALAVVSEDDVLAVRSCIPEGLLAVLPHEPEYALELFGRLVDADDDLLATGPVEHFLHWAARSHLDALRPLILRMMASDVAGVRQAGARQGCLAALGDAEANDLAEAALTGDPSCRRGAAEVFSANVKQSAFRDICIGSLTRLFDDNDAEVRNEAADCFRLFNDAELGEFRDLVLAFIASRAFPDGYDDLLFSLKESTADMSEESIAAGEAYIQMLSGGSAAPGAARHTTTLSAVILRAYNRTTIQALRDRALDVIDALLAGQSYGIDRALAQYDGE